MCGPIKGCEEVAFSEYSRIGGVPVAVYGVGLSLLLLTLAIAWWKTDLYGLLLAHYGLSLAGVIFEAYFMYLQVFVIHAVCIWCTTYGVSLILRFVVAFAVWLRQPPPEHAAGPGLALGVWNDGCRVPGELDIGLTAKGSARPALRRTTCEPSQ